jgi:hypothetical protein
MVLHGGHGGWSDPLIRRLKGRKKMTGQISEVQINTGAELRTPDSERRNDYFEDEHDDEDEDDLSSAESGER